MELWCMIMASCVHSGTSFLIICIVELFVSWEYGARIARFSRWSILVCTKATHLVGIPWLYFLPINESRAAFIFLLVGCSRHFSLHFARLSSSKSITTTKTIFFHLWSVQQPSKASRVVYSPSKIDLQTYGLLKQQCQVLMASYSTLVCENGIRNLSGTVFITRRKVLSFLVSGATRWEWKLIFHRQGC